MTQTIQTASTFMFDKEKLIQAIEQLRENSEGYIDYEADSEDGWIDACNAILNLIIQKS